jgi:hypothetical protein
MRIEPVQAQTREMKPVKLRLTLDQGNTFLKGFRTVQQFQTLIIIRIVLCIVQHDLKQRLDTLMMLFLLLVELTDMQGPVVPLHRLLKILQCQSKHFL